MRMAGPDIVLFVIGALLFGGASFAIVTSEDGAGGATSALGVFNVAWTSSEIEVGSTPAASMRSVTAEFEVTQERILAVHIVVSCTDPASVGPAAFQLQVTATGPNGLTGDGSGPCGTPIDIEIPVGELPEALAVQGTTEDEARANLVAPANEPARGNWTVTVTGARTGQPPVGLPGVDPAGTIALHVDAAQARLTPVQR